MTEPWDWTEENENYLRELLNLDQEQCAKAVSESYFPIQRIGGQLRAALAEIERLKQRATDWRRNAEENADAFMKLQERWSAAQAQIEQQQHVIGGLQEELRMLNAPKESGEIKQSVRVIAIDEDIAAKLKVMALRDGSE